MFIKVVIYLALSAFFWAFYVYSRPKKKMFLVNFLLVLVLFSLLERFLLKPLGASIWWLNLAMFAGIILHHGSILTHKNGSKMTKIHGPVSHLLFFGAFGISSTLMAIHIYPLIGNIFECLIFGLFVTMSMGTVALGFWAGFDRIFYVRLNKKFKRFYKLASDCGMIDKSFYE